MYEVKTSPLICRANLVLYDRDLCHESINRRINFDFYSNFHRVSCKTFLVTPWIYLRYYFYYWVVVAAGTAVDSVGNFGTYNDGILVVMGVGIVDAAIVIVVVAVVVGVNRNNF